MTQNQVEAIYKSLMDRGLIHDYCVIDVDNNGVDVVIKPVPTSPFVHVPVRFSKTKVQITVTP